MRKIVKGLAFSGFMFAAVAWSTGAIALIGRPIWGHRL